MTEAEVLAEIKSALVKKYGVYREGRTLRKVPYGLNWVKQNEMDPIRYVAKGKGYGIHLIQVATQLQCLVISYKTLSSYQAKRMGNIHACVDRNNNNR